MSGLGTMGLLAAMDVGYRRGDLTTFSILSPPRWDFDAFRFVGKAPWPQRRRRPKAEKRAKRKAQNKARAVTKSRRAG